MGFSRQEHWSGLSCLPLGDLPDPGIEPGSPALQAECLPFEPPAKWGMVPNSLGSCEGKGQRHSAWPMSVAIHIQSFYTTVPKGSSSLPASSSGMRADEETEAQSSSVCSSRLIHLYPQPPCTSCYTGMKAKLPGTTLAVGKTSSPGPAPTPPEQPPWGLASLQVCCRVRKVGDAGKWEEPSRYLTDVESEA